MQRVNTQIEGVFLLEPTVFGDHRGYFMESYQKQNLADLGLAIDFVQDNQSLSVESGTLRGLHYQLAPKAQSKLVRVLQGSIYDVAVDIREDSPSFMQWVAVELSAENKRQLFIPKGFAHGFCTLEPNTIVFYKVDEYYSPEHDCGILWNDADLQIPWPTKKPILSAKDEKHPSLKEARRGK